MAEEKLAEEKPLWTQYRVTLEFITKLCASVPADKNLIKTWLEARQPQVRPPGARSIDEINEEVLASLGQQPEEEVSGLIFQRNPSNGGNLVLRAATIRAHIKDCSRVISSFYVGKIEKERSFAVKVRDCVYHDPTEYWLPIKRLDGTLVYAADGTMERPVHAIDASGRPINALKLFEYLEPARIDFTLRILGGIVRIKDLETLFMYGGTHGYGGERSNGEGRYTFTISEIEEGKEVKPDGRERKGKRQDLAKDNTRSELRS